MTARTGPSELDLIPWDFTSEEHTQRAYLQRVSCGWRWDEVQDWVENCKAGKMMVYWLVSPRRLVSPTITPGHKHLTSPQGNPRQRVRP